METYSRSILQISLLALFFLLAIGIDQLYAAWSAPTGNPPTCNAGDPGCDAPITTGATNQVKDGALTVGTFSASNTRAMVVYGALATKGWAAIGTDNVMNTTQAPAQLLHLRGKPKIDGIRFPDDTEQVTAYPPAGGAGLVAVRTYSSDATWTKPANISHIIVEVWGGGASGENYGAVSGTAGGDTCFGGCAAPFVRANGGKIAPTSGRRGGDGGVASGGRINMPGGNGGSVQAFDSDISAAGGDGGDSPRGGAGGNGGYGNNVPDSSGRNGTFPGGGGGGAGDHHSANGPAGGGAGGYAWDFIRPAALPSTVNVVVGAGGVGVPHGSGNGGNGAGGLVVVYEYQ